ncbi:MAG: hypothetical protein ABMA02_16850 [Saprospiraceae bacterium]
MANPPTLLLPPLERVAIAEKDKAEKALRAFQREKAERLLREGDNFL